MIEEKTIKVLIADDNFLIREGLKTTIKGLEGLFLIGEVQHFSEITSKVKCFLPDILLLELNLCERSISELINEVKMHSSKTRIMVMSDCDCSLPVLASIKAGISGFLRKNVSQQELIDAINAIISGEKYFTNDIINILLQSYSKPATPKAHNLSARELEILHYICKGNSNLQIANALFLSEKTVATHKRNIMRKTHINKTSDLIIWALQNNVIKNN